MKSFKKKILNLPFLLLLSFITFLIVTHNVQIADSIIVIALCGLYSATFYFDLQEQPDYSKQIKSLEDKLALEMKELKNDMNTINLSVKSPNISKRISF